jgi:hydrogenase expression/formation protein HypC
VTRRIRRVSDVGTARHKEDENMCLAVPGEILSVAGEELERTGKVSFGGVVKEVSLACLPDAQVGDFVLVHAGVALQTVDAEEAARVFEYLREMEELAAAEDARGERD